ncbi:maturation protein [ssRNA phage Gerhypos.1_22]|uniref:Maturation protein n=2 Tax=Fiersviridae TaxID=2842319 RepID=A0A8S5KYC1_9VIRU|nr:maturation protein [ssRNA phage Gerhypos.1_22]QDH89113.1 MAG: hypothetical protein H1Bulk29384_000002 [Leviviridae sp.]DAD50304.1 TPA_asm: maturation protein [ssRNA phage Gerhypos.1_22]
MTTPSISRFERSGGRGTYTIVRNDGTIYTEPYGFAIWQQIEETRPESINNPRDASGWRKPSGWYHNYRSGTPNPLSAGVKITGPYNRQYYTDGAGWSDDMASPSAPDGNDEDRAIIKALSKLKNQKVNLAQAFAEREQLVKMFYDNANTICHTIEAFRRKNPKYLWEYIRKNEGRNRGKNVPKNWLELQYGWKPLMSDIQGSADQIAASSGQKFRASVVGAVNQKRSITRNKLNSFGPGIVVVGSSSVTTKVRLDYYLDSPILATLAQIGITNPVNLAWELFPYSFVVDWFTDVGGWLNSMDAALGWTFKGGTKTVFSKVVERGSHFLPATFNGVETSEGYGMASSYNCYAVSHSRTVYVSSPLPGFPGLKNPMSTGHVANALALFATAFR